MIFKHNPHGAAHQKPDSIIVHAMAETVDGTPAYEFLEKSGLSAHVLIAPSGEIIRCRNDDEGAYHARGFNSNSLGVEILVGGVSDYDEFARRIKGPYVTEAQYDALVALCREWRRTYNIQKDKISRHSDVSPGRKIDPGAGFPWTRFMWDLRP